MDISNYPGTISPLSALVNILLSDQNSHAFLLMYVFNIVFRILPREGTTFAPGKAAEHPSDLTNLSVAMSEVLQSVLLRRIPVGI